jgi:hypothetical protein
MKPATLIVLVILIVAAVAGYIVLSPKPPAKPSPTSPAPTAVKTAPAETTIKAPVKTAVEQSASGRIDAARLEFKGNWFPGSRVESLKQVEDRYGPWKEYQAIIWASAPDGKAAQYYARYFELGSNCGMAYRYNSPKPFYDAGLNAYLENVFRSPFFYLKDHSKRPEAEYPSWSEVEKIFEKDRSRKDLLERKPSLNDPAMWKIQEDILTKETVGPWVNLSRKPVAVNLRDEPSVTQSANPFDYDFSPVALEAFRKWLEKQYGTLDALNASWQTAFTAWSEVVPLTADEIKDREYKRLDAENKMFLAPWADHREFMDVTFAEITKKFVDYVHTMLPGAYVGLEGLQMPNTYGGYDYWRLIRAMTWAEPYDIRCSREIARSFNPNIPYVSTGFERDHKKLLTKMWYLALMGDRGIIAWIFDDKNKDLIIDRDNPDLPITEGGKEMSLAYRDLRSGPADLITTCERQYTPIAIYYSQASIRADWMFESRGDKSTWIRRFSSYESGENKMARAREALGKLIEDLGYQYNYVSYEQIANGELTKSGYRVLFAPRIHALSKKEAVQVKEFAESGGIVLTDIWPGIMDEHCDTADTGFRSVFGRTPAAKIDWQDSPSARDIPLPGGKSLNLVTFSDGSGVAETTIGEGRTIALGADIFFPYEKERFTANGEVIRAFVDGLIKEADIKSVGVTVADNSGKRPVAVETHFYRGKSMDIVALGRNAPFRITEELKDLAEKSGATSAVTVKVTLPYKAFVYDVGRKGFLGETDTVQTDVLPERPAILVMLSYEVAAVNAKIEPITTGVKVSGTIDVKGSPKSRAMHVLTVFTEQDGQRYPVSQIFSEDGTFAADVAFPSGTKLGDVKVIVRDAASTLESSATVKIPEKGPQF